MSANARASSAFAAAFLAALIIYVYEQEAIAERMKENKDMELQKLCEEDLSDVAGGTAAGLDQDYFTRGGINIQRTGVIKTPHAPSMSAGSNDLPVEEIDIQHRDRRPVVLPVAQLVLQPREGGGEGHVVVHSGKSAVLLNRN